MSNEEISGTEAQTIDAIIDCFCLGEREHGLAATRLQDGVVVGPVVYRTTRDGDRQWYVIFGGAHDAPGGVEFHCDRIDCRHDRELASDMREKIKVAFEARDVAVTMFDGRDGEFEMAKYCAERWPCEKSNSILTGMKRDRFQDELAAYAEELPSVPMDEYMEKVMRGEMVGKVAHMVHRHDEWCRSQNGGSPDECDCNPDVSMHVEPERH